MGSNTSDSIELRSPISGTVVAIRMAAGQQLAAGRAIFLIESMKMEHPVTAEQAIELVDILVVEGQAVLQGELLAVAIAADSPEAARVEVAKGESSVARRLAELVERAAQLGDDARPERVAKRKSLGLRTARTNIDDLVDLGSFVEYGRFAYAAQSARRSTEELIAETPGDGLVGGIGTVNAAIVGPERSRCVVASYDYMVLAGTQGQRNHRKKDRLFELAQRLELPVILFTEGGGGRPGDTDMAVVTGLDTRAFELFARLSGQVPSIAVVAGRCFAGNAALAGCCDVIVAVRGASFGMGGPAMIEGGGLGVVAAEDVGPVEMHMAAGSVDLVTNDEAEAVGQVKRLLSYFQGRLPDAVPPDPEQLRTAVPDDRRRAFNPRQVIEGLADVGSILELRKFYARNIVTCLARLDGRPVAVLANDSSYLAGAIDADAADKAARFLQLAEARGLPVLSLIDTPGFMVGPEAEATGLVRHVSRMFVAGAALRSPLLAVITRRAYGLGAQAMAGGSFAAPLATLAWPTGELGGMGLEGAIRLGFRRELEAIDDPDDREAAETSLIDAAYEQGRALNVAAHLEIDDVIDPADTRSVLLNLLDAGSTELEPRPRFIDPA